MGKLKQTLIDACEKLDWTVREYEDGSVEKDAEDMAELFGGQER